ncbi:hypothetical protein WMY93_014213 [Mugilogobius chulae]|uniref:Uncharacterized protein n=1 Tax=Mugilogobius chulae TaxID=88201 RepID=A0AAW0NWB9_9GOBI
MAEPISWGRYPIQQMSDRHQYPIQGLSHEGNAMKTPIHQATVEKFARNMANEIVQSVQKEMEDFGNSERKDEKQEDYPDAPPPTPLDPEMQKTRQSFTRKLKGGLAKEFTPSPPPPTPTPTTVEHQKDEFDAKAELMTQLMRSLSAGESDKGKIEEFAEALSTEVMKRAFAEVGERLCAEILGVQMAKVIVKCSLDEVRRC